MKGTVIATALFYMLVKKAGGLFASLVTYGIPFVAIGWGFVFGEDISLLQIACLGVILIGVYLANLPNKKPAMQEFEYENEIEPGPAAKQP